MNRKDNIIEASHFEAMRRVLEPTKEGIDPGVDFEGCIREVMDKVMGEVVNMSNEEAQTYFRHKAQAALRWCEDTPDVPTILLDKVQAWVRQQTN